MNASLTRFARTAPTVRPRPAVGFTTGSLIELAALGFALLLPAVACGQERTAADFGPDPTATARYESNGGYGGGLYDRPAPTRGQSPRGQSRDEFRSEPAGRAAPRATPKPQPSVADRLAYRYDDPKVVRFATGTGWSRLVNLYVESSQLIDARHRAPNAYAARVAQALENLSEAVGNDSFRRAHRVTADAGTVRSFRDRLAGLNARSVRDRNDALEVMRQTASLARTDLGLSPDAVAAEFLFGAVESLDKYSGFLPSETRTGYGADLTVVPAMYAAEQAAAERTAGALDTSVVGLGVELKEHDRGVVIVKPLAGGPAAEAGLRRGDVITEVDGRSLSGRGLNGAADLIVGREGSPVRLRVMRGERYGTFNLRRARVELKTVSVTDLMTAPDGSKVGYLKLDRFAATTKTELDEALWKLYRGGMKSLVIDLRGNPGGLLDQAISVSDTFLPGGTIVSTRGRLAEDNMSSAAKKSRTWKLPMAVIVDDGSASASEIFAAAVQDNRRGVIVGRNSYGKGTVQTHFPVRTVPGDLKLTTALFYSPAGRQMADQGVAPDVTVSEDRDILPLDRDADVLAALTRRHQPRRRHDGRHPRLDPVTTPRRHPPAPRRSAERLAEVREGNGEQVICPASAAITKLAPDSVQRRAACRGERTRTAERAGRTTRPRSAGAPPGDQFPVDAQLIHDPGDDEVDEVVHAGHAVVEARHRRQQHGAGGGDRLHVPEVDRRQRRLPRHEDQFAALLQVHRGGPVDQVRAQPPGDARQRAHRTGTDYHPGGAERPARRAGGPVDVPVHRQRAAARRHGFDGTPRPREPHREQRFEVQRRRRQFQVQFVAEHLHGGGAEDRVHVPPRGKQNPQQSHRVRRPAGSRDADHDGGLVHSLTGRRARRTRGASSGRRRSRRSARRAARRDDERRTAGACAPGPIRGSFTASSPCRRSPPRSRGG